MRLPLVERSCGVSLGGGMVEWWNGGREPNACEGWNRVVEDMGEGRGSQEKEGSGTLLVLRIYSPLGWQMVRRAW